jgi:hypothetical protein
MAWETRGERRYYYQSVRVGGKYVRRYLGSGPEAEKVAEAIRRRKEARLAESEARHHDEERHAAAVAPLLELFGLTELIVKATLVNGGFRQHSRGEWRSERHDKTSKSGHFRQGLSRGSKGHPGEGQQG